MATLELLPVEPGTGSHGGEVFCCAYAPDGTVVLSAGWDGHLRLWETSSGAHLNGLRVGSKPLSACALSPDGKQWLSGSLDGMLAVWDPATGQQLSTFLAHTRPLSAILFTPDGNRLVTASWDRNLTVWDSETKRETRTLAGHEDIIAGCRIMPDGRTLLSWSHDRTLRSWDLEHGQPMHIFAGHTDRVTAGAVSPDGCWAASGSRDRMVKLWDLTTGQEVNSVAVGSEVRGCFFLLDGQSLVIVDASGRLTWHTLPGLEEQAELITRLPVQCADLSPSGGQIVLGCDDGRPRFVAVAGFEHHPLVVTPIQTRRRTRTVLDRLLGRSRITSDYSCTCPACGRSFHLQGTRPGQPAPCPHCRRSLRLSTLTRVVSEV